jgi:hypothetical protein
MISWAEEGEEKRERKAFGIGVWGWYCGLFC